MRGTEPIIGSEFAGYRIEAEAGRGGMGVVFRARDTALDREIALKVIAAELSHDGAFRERFEREARLSASIDHPHVIPVYRAGTEGDLLYIAMRLVQGPDLRTLIATRGTLAPTHASSIMSQIASALDAAHARGLVHRDVKPANVLLESRDGREHAYLTDFGLTKHTSSSSGVTRSGTVVGTLDFLAPEQIAGHAVDGKADIYALGCVLFQSLTGEIPFARESDVAKLYAHVNDAPPKPSALVEGLGPAFDAVIERALAKNPHDRFASAGELARAALEASDGIAPRPAPPDATSIRARSQPQMALTSPSPASPFGAPAPAGPPTSVDLEVAADRPARFRSRSRWARRRLPSPDHSRATNRIVDEKPAHIPLDPRFVYLHEPLRDDGPIGLLGNDDVIEDLVRRMVHSSGGSFLVAGFRGVGKTTIVDRVSDGVARCLEPTHLITIKLNVARRRTTSELLFEIIRKLYDEVEDRDLGPMLDDRLRERLSIAYRRTSLSLTETSTNAVERARGISVPLPVGIGSPKIDASRKATESLAHAASFLPYSDAEVEQDFEQIVRLFEREAPPQPERRFSRLVGRRPAPPRTKCRLLIVVDELDKLTGDEDGRRSVEQLFAGLKNLLTIRGAHFLFVAGPDLHEQALDERHGGNSVYDAVFGLQAYVPCIWDREDKLLDELITDPEIRQSDEARALRDHLAFWGRGVPRLLVGALQTLVRWDEDRPIVRLEGEDLDMVRSYANLERLIRDFIDPRAAGHPRGIELDKWRLAIYYAVEWILRFEVTFTVQDVVALARSAGGSIHPMLGLEEPEVEELLTYLAEHGIVRQVSGRLPNHTFYGSEPETQVAAYEVTDGVEALLRDIQPLESQTGGVPAADVPLRVPSAVFRGAVGSTMDGGRYRLLDEVDRSGAALVYRAHDSRTQRDVAVKVLEVPGSGPSEAMRARFVRGAQIAIGLDHPGIVRTYERFEEADGRMAVVMEFLPGRSLAQRIRSPGPLVPRRGVVVADVVLEALDYLHRQGLARLDLRPASIMLPDGRTPKLVNLGLLKHADGSDDVTPAGAMVGTPTYCAPEQLDGRPVDIRTDIFALGLILYEAIGGRPARIGSSVGEVLEQVSESRVDVSALAGSDELRDVIARSTAPEPSDRYSSPAEMRTALGATPEAAAEAEADGTL